MNFLISATFTDSLARLTAQEQKATKTTAFDLQMDPSSPGLSFHRVDRAKDTNFWSVRVNDDLRIIVHRTPASFLLAYVDRHDAAYRWAERRKLESHPTTGAMQLVEVRERVEQITIPAPKPAAAPAKAKLFDNLRKFELMAFGVPEEWIGDVRAADEDTLFDVITHLPQEAQEALLKLAVGERPRQSAMAAMSSAPVAASVPNMGAATSGKALPTSLDQPTAPSTPFTGDPFLHPDALRRFRVIGDVEALRRALDEPWERWAVFLHPSQAALVSRDFSGPARASGSAGTGKTVVALHRAVHLASTNSSSKVLLTTFSDTLARALKVKLKTLVSGEPDVAARIVVKAIGRVGSDLYSESFGAPKLVAPETVRASIAEAAKAHGGKFSLPFLVSEWADVIEPWLVRSKEDYAKAPRLGRKTRLSAGQREALWPLFAAVRKGITARGETTVSDMFDRIGGAIAEGETPPFTFAVVDEAQDLGVAEARFLAALGGGRPNALFFSGDLGQRIFQAPFSWKSLGLDIRGRSYTLRVNYRTSHQIRSQADRLLPTVISDVDGNEEGRKGTVSVFNGPPPDVQTFRTVEEEAKAIGGWLAARVKEGVKPEEIGVFVRSAAELDRASAAAKAAGVPTTTLSGEADAVAGSVAVSPMHLAKGLEFRAVAVMACDDEILPQQDRIETVADDAELEEVYNTERHLLYVACTRARDHLIVSGVEPVSEFLPDFKATDRRL